MHCSKGRNVNRREWWQAAWTRRRCVTMTMRAGARRAAFHERDHVLDGRKFAFLRWKDDAAKTRIRPDRTATKEGGAIVFAMPSGASNDREGTVATMLTTDDVKSDDDIDDECVEECACKSDRHRSKIATEDSRTRPERTIRAWRVRKISSPCSIRGSFVRRLSVGHGAPGHPAGLDTHSCQHQQYHGSPSWWRARPSKRNKRSHAGRRQCGSEPARPEKHKCRAPAASAFAAIGSGPPRGGRSPPEHRPSRKLVQADQPIIYGSREPPANTP